MCCYYRLLVCTLLFDAANLGVGSSGVGCTYLLPAVARTNLQVTITIHARTSTTVSPATIEMKNHCRLMAVKLQNHLAVPGSKCSTLLRTCEYSSPYAPLWIRLQPPGTRPRPLAPRQAMARGRPIMRGRRPSAISTLLDMVQAQPGPAPCSACH